VGLSVTPNSAAAPAAITLTATATDSDGTIAKVEFYNGATLLATVTQAPYTYAWNNVAAGSYQLTAKATDNLAAVATSAVQTVTVTAAAGTQIFYIYADQIDTAREITNAAGVKVWQADPEPFGANLPNENPAGQGQFTYNPRFPGQYFDRETGLHYNSYRDYDPQTGRYVQSDPIGLDGGINTYAYVEGNPLSSNDPEGLQTRSIFEKVLRGSGPPPIIDPTTGQNINQINLDGDYSRSRDRESAEDARSRNPPISMAGNGGVGNSSGVGTNTPYKHCKEDPKDPNFIICKDPNGKKVRKKKPSDWPKPAKNCP
jgi:RHS repeat-associated protein